MNSRTLFLLAGICAFSVANIYYNQPLLMLFARSFQSNAAGTSMISMAIQLSYAAGLVLFVPLGDLLDRRVLLSLLITVNAASSALAACAPTLALLIAANIAIGMSSVGAQIVIPAVSLMTAPERRGRAVGIVMSGLLSGILLARTLAGFVGSLGGWRSMYWLAVAIDCALLPLVAIALPKGAKPAGTPYLALLRSLASLFRRESELRQACLCGALMFGSFSALWGALAYLLSNPPYRFASDVAGSFGLAGIAGIFATPYVGRLADRFDARTVVLLGALLTATAFVLISGAGSELALLVAGVVILDIGGRAGLVGNQLRALALSESARSRLNTLFMACYFLGGALGTRAGAVLGTQYGWKGIAMLGLSTSLLVILLNSQAIVPFLKRSNP
jgi:predicted MFS family arabinose efflux permease